MNNKMHIQNFPSPLLNKIFSYVDERDLCNNVPFVCEKWKLASSHSLQVKNAYFEGESVSAKDICFVLYNSPSLESITLVSCNNIVPILRQISRCNTSVEKLILKHCTSKSNMIPEDVLINILWSLPQLKIIELFHTRFRSHLFFDLLARLPNITSIDLSLNDLITVEDLMQLVHNSSITEFKLSRRHQEPRIADEELSHLIRMLAHRLVLLHLDMGGVGGVVYNDILSCAKLVDLTLNNALYLNKSVLKKFPHQLRKIKHLSIEGPTEGLNTGDLYSSLFLNNEFGKQIESLKLKKCDSLDDDECINVIKSCPNLSVLSLKGCKCLSVHGIARTILEDLNLKYLNIAFLGNTSKEVNIQSLGEIKELVVDEVSLKKINIFDKNDELNIKILK